MCAVICVVCDGVVFSAVWWCGVWCGVLVWCVRCSDVVRCACSGAVCGSILWSVVLRVLGDVRCLCGGIGRGDVWCVSVVSCIL